MLAGEQVERRTRLWLLLILAVALALRLGSSFLLPQPVERDAAGYDALGRNLLASHGLVYAQDDHPTAQRGPIYPAFLALVYLIAGVGNYPAIWTAQALLELGTIALVFDLARRLYARRSLGLLAAALVAVYPPLIRHTGTLLTETLFTLLLVSGIWLWLLALWSNHQERRWPLALGGGLVLGLAALSRPVVLLLPVLLVAVGLWCRALGWRLPLALVLGCLLLLTPWTVRNYQLFGTWAPGATLSGINLWLSHYRLAEDDYWAGVSIEESRRVLRAQLTAAGVDPGQLNEAEFDRAAREQALQLIAQHPDRYLERSLNRFWRLWFNLGFGGPPSLASLLFAAIHGSFLLLAIVSTWLARPRFAGERHRARLKLGLWTLWSVLIYFTLSHMAILAYGRFIVPVIPLVIVIAVGVGPTLVERIPIKRGMMVQ